MSSRGKKKKERKATHAPEPELRGDETPDIALTTGQERWLEMFFGSFVFFITAGGGTYELFESWILSLVCGTIAAIVAIILVRRGDTLF